MDIIELRNALDQAFRSRFPCLQASDRDDLVQETIIRLLETGTLLIPKVAEYAWSIAQSLLKRQSATRSRRREIPFFSDPECLEECGISDVLSLKRLRFVSAAMASINPRVMVFLIDRHVHQKAVPVIAAEHLVSLTTVHSALYRGRKQLRNLISRMVRDSVIASSP